MRARLTSRALGFLGLSVLGVLALGILRGSVSLQQAATRAVITLVVLLLVERLVLPVAQALVGRPRAVEAVPPADGPPAAPESS